MSINADAGPQRGNPLILHSLLNDEAGAAAIEYSLMAAGIALAIITIVASLGDRVIGMFAAAAAAFG